MKHATHTKRNQYGFVMFEAFVPFVDGRRP